MPAKSPYRVVSNIVGTFPVSALLFIKPGLIARVSFHRRNTSHSFPPKQS